MYMKTKLFIMSGINDCGSYCDDVDDCTCPTTMYRAVQTLQRIDVAATNLRGTYLQISHRKASP